MLGFFLFLFLCNLQPSLLLGRLILKSLQIPLEAVGPQVAQEGRLLGPPGAQGPGQSCTLDKGSVLRGLPKDKGDCEGASGLGTGLEVV